MVERKMRECDICGGTEGVARWTLAKANGGVKRIDLCVEDGRPLEEILARPAPGIRGQVRHNVVTMEEIAALKRHTGASGRSQAPRRAPNKAPRRLS